ncbi:MAG: DUF6588 family protein [Elusimicrobiota bacterium]
MRKWLVLVVVFVFPAFIWAGTPEEDLQTAKDAVQADYSTVSGWFSEQLADGLAFHEQGGLALPGSVCSLLGFELGVSGGGSVWNLDVDKFRKLSVKAVDVSSLGGIDLPDKIGAPSLLAHAKIGLPFGLDVGGKGGKITWGLDNGNARTDIESTVWGVEVRKRLLGGGLTGVVLPDLSVNLSLNTASGFIKRTEVYEQTTPGIIYGENTYTQTINSTTTWRSDWDIKSLGLQAVLSKNFIVVTPFVGVGFYKNMGKVNTAIRTEGNIALTGIPTDPLSLEGKGDKAPKDTNLRYMAGLEMNITLLKLGISADYSDGMYAGNAVVRIQFR